jgi:stage II sporulation protein D
MGCGDRQYDVIRRSRCSLHAARLLSSTILLLLIARNLAGALPEPVAPRLRPVRVLIVDGAREFRLRAGFPLVVRGANGDVIRTATSETLSVSSDASRLLRINGITIPHSTLTIAPSSGPVFLASRADADWSLETEYPGAFRVTARDSGVNVINEVSIEEYVGCVVANEVWPTFHAEAFRGQAVVSRTFVLYQMGRRAESESDLTATQGSQVYRGIRRDEVGERAMDAARYTHGIALTHPDSEGKPKIFCTYYSAACGGRSQSAAFFGPEGDIPPLHGGVECDHCRIAPGETYRWGPVTLPVAEVMARLASRYPNTTRIGTITAIEAIEQTDAGRTVTLRLTGSGGGHDEMLAERFRLAVDPMRIRSTHFRVRVEGDQVVFEDGRGFGHGMGLCQWGMEGQAREGRSAGQILRYYFPGAQLTRAY